MLAISFSLLSSFVNSTSQILVRYSSRSLWDCNYSVGLAYIKFHYINSFAIYYAELKIVTLANFLLLQWHNQHIDYTKKGGTQSGWAFSIPSHLIYTIYIYDITDITDDHTSILVITTQHSHYCTTHTCT